MMPDALKSLVMWLLGLALVGALTTAIVKTLNLAKVQTELANFKAKTAQERTVQEKRYADDQDSARKKEQALQADANKYREDYDKATKNLAAARTAFADSLRTRPERPAAPQGGGASAPACTASCGTGAGLYRPDADVAWWFATEAAQRAIERDLCYLQYNKARDSLAATPDKP